MQVKVYGKYKKLVDYIILILTCKKQNRKFGVQFLLVILKLIQQK
jgi:hypothetical protein